MKTYRAGIIGTGPIGGLTGADWSHAAGYRDCARTDLVAAADLQPERLAQFDEHWHLGVDHLYTDHAEMLRRECLDLVSVCTGNRHHVRPVIDAVEAGALAVWCEKPIATSVSDGREMVRVCQGRGVPLVVNHNRRFSVNYGAVGALLRGGRLGPIDSMQTEWSRPLLQNGTHGIDACLMLMDDRPIRVSGYLRDEGLADPGGAGTVLFESGAVLSFHATAKRAFVYAGVTIQCHQGRVRIEEYDDRYLAWAQEEGKARTYRPIDIPGLDLSAPRLPHWSCGPEAMVACIEQGRPNPSSGEAALVALEVIVAMHVSHRTGAWVAVPLADGLADHEIRSTGQ